MTPWLSYIKQLNGTLITQEHNAWYHAWQQARCRVVDGYAHGVTAKCVYLPLQIDVYANEGIAQGRGVVYMFLSRCDGQVLNLELCHTTSDDFVIAIQKHKTKNIFPFTEELNSHEFAKEFIYSLVDNDLSETSVGQTVDTFDGDDCYRSINVDLMPLISHYKKNSGMARFKSPDLFTFFINDGELTGFGHALRQYVRETRPHQNITFDHVGLSDLYRAELMQAVSVAHQDHLLVQMKKIEKLGINLDDDPFSNIACYVNDLVASPNQDVAKNRQAFWLSIYLLANEGVQKTQLKEWVSPISVIEVMTQNKLIMDKQLQNQIDNNEPIWPLLYHYLRMPTMTADNWECAVTLMRFLQFSSATAIACPPAYRLKRALLLSGLPENIRDKLKHPISYPARYGVWELVVDHLEKLGNQISQTKKITDIEKMIGQWDWLTHTSDPNRAIDILDETFNVSSSLDSYSQIMTELLNTVVLGGVYSSLKFNGAECLYFDKNELTVKINESHVIDSYLTHHIHELMLLDDAPLIMVVEPSKIKSCLDNYTGLTDKLERNDSLRDYYSSIIELGEKVENIPEYVWVGLTDHVEAHPMLSVRFVPITSRSALKRESVDGYQYCFADLRCVLDGAVAYYRVEDDISREHLATLKLKRQGCEYILDHFHSNPLVPSKRLAGIERQAKYFLGEVNKRKRNSNLDLLKDRAAMQQLRKNSIDEAEANPTTSGDLFLPISYKGDAACLAYFAIEAFAPQGMGAKIMLEECSKHLYRVFQSSKLWEDIQKIKKYSKTYSMTPMEVIVNKSSSSNKSYEEWSDSLTGKIAN
jgi:hypothetical protein